MNPTTPIDSVPVLDLTRQYATIEREVVDAVTGVLQSGGYILGTEVAAFEEEAAEYCGVKHAIGVASGTDALLLSLRALGVGPGDAVLLPSFTFFATAGVVHNVGAKPVFVDIDPETFNVDPEHLRALMQDVTLRRTAKAIIPVHLYGQTADMTEIMDVATEHGLAVIEDAAQAIGATYRRSLTRPSEPHEPNELSEPRKAGSIGSFGAFSFYPTKNLGACGDGGMITTNDDAAAEKVRLLRVHGAKPKYYHRMIGTNSRLDAMQAAILRVKLRYLDAWSEARRRVADVYDEALSSVSGITPPRRGSGRTHIFHQYTVRVTDGKRDALREYLKEQGVGSMIYYPVPLHLQECFKDLGYHEGDLPVSEKAASEVLSLPIFPEITPEEQGYVVETIRGFYGA